MSERSNAVPNYLRIYRHPGRLNNQVVRTSVNNRDLAWSGKYKVELEVTEEEDNFKKADTIALYFKSRKHAISVLNEEGFDTNNFGRVEGKASRLKRCIR